MTTPPSVTRRRLLTHTAAAAATLAARPLLAMPFPKPEHELRERPAPADRHFRSPAIEAAITRMQASCADPVLNAMFGRCFPNTLDSTVFPGTLDGHPDTYVITGDIDAMWLRDSAAQMWPYLPFARQDPALAQLIEGVIRRQGRLILRDSYANAFTRNLTDPPLPWAVGDHTEHFPGVAERKWEIDSLCYAVRLAYGYWKATGSTAPFNAAWRETLARILATFVGQQRLHGPGPYSFTREARSPTDTLAESGRGNPARPVGLLFSGFRPSDDACTYPLFIPANLFAVVTLGRMAEFAQTLYHDTALAGACTALAQTVTGALAQHGTTIHPSYGQIWAYEVDGYSNVLQMDDANAPGLLSLPYLDLCRSDDPLYRRTRSFSLSPANPYFFRGAAAEGVGGPHIGQGYIWPMSIILRALTSTDDAEILGCLTWLRDTTAGTHFMHESFQQDNPADYTRTWFAWANGLFGELLLKVQAERPALLQHRFGVPG